MESVQVGKKVLQRTSQQLQGFGIPRLLTGEEELLPKHLQNGGSIQTCRNRHIIITQVGVAGWGLIQANQLGDMEVGSHIPNTSEAAATTE